MNGFDRTYSGANNAYLETSSNGANVKEENSDPNSVTIGSVLNKYEELLIIS